MNLIKTSFLSIIYTAVKIISNIFIIKIISVLIGPSGIGILGQFQNFVNIIINISTCGINTAIVKYTAEYNKNDILKNKIWNTSISLFFFSSIPIFIILLLLSNFFSLYLFKTDNFKHIIMLYAFTFIFSTLSNFIASILNGQKSIKKLVMANIISSFLNIPITFIFIKFYFIKGILFSYIISQIILFIILFYYIKSEYWFSYTIFKISFDIQIFKKLFNYSLMILTSSITTSLSQIYLRSFLIKKLGLDVAGYWQSILKISETYLMIITTLLGLYYLPRLSEISDKKELKSEIIKCYKLLIPIIICLSLIIFLSRDLIITFFLDEKFKPIKNLFAFQLIGDIFKIMSWLLSYLMLAKAMTKTFIISEILFTINWVILSIIFINLYNLVGITISFAVNYLIYFIFCYLYFSKFLKT